MRSAPVHIASTEKLITAFDCAGEGRDWIFTLKLFIFRSNTVYEGGGQDEHITNMPWGTVPLPRWCG
jgi:hypothetical protein